MRLKRSSPKVLHRAAELRQEMTRSEKILWGALRDNKLRGVSFRRSHAIGPYVADFCAPSQKIVVELDGEPHRSQQDADAERTQYLESLGYTVVRFWNSQIEKDLNGTLRKIERVILHKHGA